MIIAYIFAAFLVLIIILCLCANILIDKYRPKFTVKCYNDLLKSLSTVKNLSVGDVVKVKETKRHYILVSLDWDFDNWKEIAPNHDINNKCRYFKAPGIRFTTYQGDAYEKDVIICRTSEFQSYVKYRQAMGVERDKFPSINRLVVDNNMDLWKVLDVKEDHYILEARGRKRKATDYDIYGVVDSTFDYYYTGDF